MLPLGDLRRSFWAKVLGLSMRKGRIIPKYHYVYGIPSLEKNYAPRGASSMPGPENYTTSIMFAIKIAIRIYNYILLCNKILIWIAVVIE